MSLLAQCVERVGVDHRRYVPLRRDVSGRRDVPGRERHSPRYVADDPSLRVPKCAGVPASLRPRERVAASPSWAKPSIGDGVSVWGHGQTVNASDPTSSASTRERRSWASAATSTRASRTPHLGRLCPGAPGPTLSGGCRVASPRSPGSATGIVPVVGLTIAPVVRRLRRSARGPKARRSAAGLRTIGGIIRRAVTGGRGASSAPRHSCGARRDGL
jgi:hypothetical protein